MKAVKSTESNTRSVDGRGSQNKQPPLPKKNLCMTMGKSGNVHLCLVREITQKHVPMSVHV